MSGKTEIFQVGVVVLALTAVVMDLVWGRIFNVFTVSALVLGIALSAVFGGWVGLGNSLLGVGAGLVLYGWMFFLKFLGGGDVKLLMALGAWGGYRYAAEVAVLGILAGGVFGLLLLLARGRLGGFARRLYRFFYTSLVPELEVEMVRIDQRQTMPFGVPIAVAAVWAAFGHPLW